MIVVQGITAFPDSPRPACLALGTFDGVHRGHQAVIQAVREEANRIGGDAVVVTFDPHPVMVIAPPREPFLLTTIDERIELLAAAGVDAAIVVKFNDEIRQMSAAGWLDLLLEHVRPRHLFASSTHAFGRNREGTPALLGEWARPRGVRVTVVPPVRNGGVVISSSATRERLRNGDIRTAADWLGRWYSVRGEVVPGDRRGRQLGMPTANLRLPPEKLVPARGVYAAYARVHGRTHKAAVNAGVRPTFGDGPSLVEAHLLDVDEDMYGRTLEVAFVHRLRDELRFESIEALKAQMQADIELIRRLLEVERNLDEW
jgi:riboflavin kinase/FMN adenylyltransferase